MRVFQLLCDFRLARDDRRVKRNVRNSSECICGKVKLREYRNGRNVSRVERDELSCGRSIAIGAETLERCTHKQSRTAIGNDNLQREEKNVREGERGSKRREAKGKRKKRGEEEERSWKRRVDERGERRKNLLHSLRSFKTYFHSRLDVAVGEKLRERVLSQMVDLPGVLDRIRSDKSTKTTPKKLNKGEMPFTMMKKEETKKKVRRKKPLIGAGAILFLLLFEIFLLRIGSFLAK